MKLKKHRDKVAVELSEQREQNQTFLSDMGKERISSLELVNSLDDGKIQTVNSMKYHTQKIKALYGIRLTPKMASGSVKLQATVQPTQANTQATATRLTQ